MTVDSGKVENMANPKFYDRPKTLEEAIKLAAHSDIALAGGALTFGRLDLPYTRVVDLQDVAELKHIERHEDSIVIGAAVMLQEVVNSPDIPDALKRSLTRAVPLNIRDGASVGESLMAPNPPHEWLAALAALNAQVEHTRPWQTMKLTGPQFWEQPVEEFVKVAQIEPFQGLISRIRLDALHPGEALGSAFVARTPADEPIVNAAAFVRVSDNRVSDVYTTLCGACFEPVIKLELSNLLGRPLDEANIASVVKTVAPRLNPVADFRGSVEYRREMARVCVQRALLDCLEQLKGAS
jgi:aerobic carbon-monoxide dehydrogenase medium subunit